MIELVTVAGEDWEESPGPELWVCRAFWKDNDSLNLGYIGVLQIRVSEKDAVVIVAWMLWVPTLWFHLKPIPQDITYAA